MAAGCGGWILTWVTHISINQKAERAENRYSGGVFSCVFFFKSRSHNHRIMASLSRTHLQLIFSRNIVRKKPKIYPPMPQAFLIQSNLQQKVTTMPGICGGLNESNPDRLLHLNAQYPVGGAVQNGLGSMALVEQVGHCGWLGFEVSNPILFPVSSPLSLLVACEQYAITQLLPQYHPCLSTSLRHSIQVLKLQASKGSHILFDINVKGKKHLLWIKRECQMITKQ